jgi:hypothetical protein
VQVSGDFLPGVKYDRIGSHEDRAPFRIKLELERKEP